MKIMYVAGVAIAGMVAIGAASVLYGAPEQEGHIRVAFFPNLGHAVPIVGTELGFFSNAETRIFDSGPQAVESLFADSLDMAYVGPGPAVNGYLKSGSKIVILAGAASGGSSFVAHPDSGMLTAADLDGKIVAAPQIANTQDVSLRSYIADGGLLTAERGGSVHVLNVANPEIYTLFAKGDIDAAWVPEPWATILVQKLDGVRLFNEESLWPGERFASVLLVARADFVKNNPDLVSGWLDSHEETVSWIESNPDATAKTFNGFMQRELRTEFPENIIREAFANIEITSDPIPSSVATFAQRADSLGYLGRGGYDLEGIFYGGGADSVS